ncbi:alpha/beta fold hydrolase [Pseudonocardia sp. KRD-182]|uniref:alpha/beta hydrolase n=1 Tax=Pseudonocardia oceani TaxID=2792013 RepID=UPI001C4A21BE|nr:alpha/beta hydrolase [Pseudonocardia oceani]MBW0107451.1 alpha/beta fold hydrolase [Pseudonocardia oceani]
MPTERTHFDVGTGACTAWVTLPPGPGPHPAVVLVHGFGATHEMALPHYERCFSEAGMAVVAFDYRFNGASPGEPRQVLRVKNLLADVNAALSFTMALPEVDPGRVGLWGTSFGASHAMVTAARRSDVAALVVNCPMIDGLDASRRLGLRHVGRLTWPITSDLLRSAVGAPPRYLPLVGEVGDFAMINTSGAMKGWYSLMPAGMDWDNRTGAAAAFDMVGYRAVRVAPRIACPFLVCVSDNETLMDPQISVEAARRAPKGRAIHYPADHFEVYHPPLVDRVVADQVGFLREALGVVTG